VSTTPETAAQIAGRVAAGGLLAAAGLHVAWGLGSSWPLSSRARLSEAVLGRDALSGDDVGGDGLGGDDLGGDDLGRDGAAACYAVAGLLGTAAALVAGHPRRTPRLRDSGVIVLAAALAGRGLLGLAGRTDQVSPVSTGSEFRRLDRRVYAPICLGLAALAALSLRPAPRVEQAP
jgi:hypothetical protein